MLRIRDVYPEPQIRIYSIPDPGSGFVSKNLKCTWYFNPKHYF
jgi:hypothetical protein